MANNNPPLAIDAQCHCEQCESRTAETYALIARCTNCSAGPFRVTFRKGDEAFRVISGTTCPHCGCSRMVIVTEEP